MSGRPKRARVVVKSGRRSACARGSMPFWVTADTVGVKSELFFSDGGASASPGLNETGLFCLHGVGPSWKIYNWGDSGSGGCEEAVVQQLVIDRWTSVCLCDFCFCRMYDFDRQKRVYRATDETPSTSNREHFIRLCGLFTLRLSANCVLLIRTQREMLILQIYFLRCEVRSR